MADTKGGHALKVAIFVAGLNCVGVHASHVLISADGWVALPARDASPGTSADRPPRQMVGVLSVDQPVIEVSRPQSPARFKVDGGQFPTFPVTVAARQGTGGVLVDRRSLKVTAHKGWLFKDITEDIAEHLASSRCEQHFCETVSLDVDQLDLSEKGVGQYRFVIRIADADGQVARSEMTVVIEG